MKKILYASLFILLGVANAVSAIESTENYLFMKDTELTKGGENTLSIEMVNADSKVTGIEFRLLLPEGVTPVFDKKNKPVVALNQDRIDDHTISAGYDATKKIITVVIMSLSNAPYYESAGEIATVKVTTAADAPDGDFNAFTGETVLAASNSVSYESTTTVGKFKIGISSEDITTATLGSVVSTVITDALTIEGAEGADVTVTNVAGTIVATATADGETTITTTTWEKGMYFVSLSKDGKSTTTKVVKK